MSEDELYLTYEVTIRYLPSGSFRRKEWVTTAREISEDDAIWTALREFRSDEIRTWCGWPREVRQVNVKRRIDG
jgi:hypothetical protein